MKELRYRLVLLGAFMIGLYLSSVEMHCPENFRYLSFLCALLPEVPRKIGDALIIAPLLALLVDEAAKTKLLREFSLDVSSHIIGRMLPVELRKYLTGYLQMFLVRTRWEISYTINEWVGQPGYISLKTTSEYDMENRAGDPKDYEFVYKVEDSLYPDIGCTQITFVRLGEDTYDGDALAKVIVAENGYQNFERKKLLQPHDAPNKPSYTFRAESIECFRNSNFSPFFAICPVMTAELSVWYPKDVVNVSLELTYDEVKTATVRSEIASGALTGTKWKILGPILPGQGFIVRWDAIPPQSAAGSQAQAPSVSPATSPVEKE